MRNIEFKIRLSPDEHDRLKNAANDCGLQYADYARYCIFGPEGSKKVPHQKQLRDVLYVISRISDNINRCMHAIHRSEKSGTLNPGQFKAMHEAIAAGLKAWEDPRDEWLSILKRLRK